MKDVQNLITFWMRMFPQNFLKAFLKCKKFPNLYLVNKTAAVAFIGFELIDILKKLFGGCPRTNQFFQFKPEIYLFDYLEELIPWKRERGKGIQISLINNFYLTGGFNDLFEFLEMVVKDEGPSQ